MPSDGNAILGSYKMQDNRFMNTAAATAAQTDVTGVSYGDTNGVVSLSMPYLALPSTSGNDELSLVFT